MLSVFEVEGKGFQKWLSVNFYKYVHDGRTARRFDILSVFVSSQVLYTANQKIAGCFTIVSGPVATTR